jgi:2-polyprenyl-3-methyl-5-hydroxy-6-metoxy-1,4-benzoquinol methylase
MNKIKTELMDYLEINRRLWDHKTEIHYQSHFYDVDAFLQGKDSLNPIELNLLGDIQGKKILHLQCHFGMDSISLSRHGAVVTGVDFSGKAIEKANDLKDALSMDTRFIQSDIYQLKDVLFETFDIVFTSYGVIGWLPDTKRWADTIAHFLKPGGRFVMAEFHPVIWMLSYDFKNIEFNYMDSAPIVEELSGTYADTKADIHDQSISWNHGLAGVVNALVHSGLVIKDFQEYNYSPYNCFQDTIELDERKFQIRGLEDKLPMVYSIMATKE